MQFTQFYNATLFLGAGVAGTCTIAPSSTPIPNVSISIFPVRCDPNVLPILSPSFLTFLLGTVCLILISVFCNRFNTPAWRLTLAFFGVDLNVLREEMMGNGVGDRSCRRGREIRSSVLGDNMDWREMDLGWDCDCLRDLMGDTKSNGPSTRSRIRGRREP